MGPDSIIAVYLLCGLALSILLSIVLPVPKDSMRGGVFVLTAVAWVLLPLLLAVLIGGLAVFLIGLIGTLLYWGAYAFVVCSQPQELRAEMRTEDYRARLALHK